MTQHYDTIILGAGPGGMTAATYASRANLSVLMIDRGIYGGQMNNTAEVENYPGFSSVLGPDLAEKMYQSSTQFGAEYAFGTVLHVQAQEDGSWRVVTDMDEYTTNTVIVATGSDYKKLAVPGEDQYSGRGVSYCAVCDGAFFRGQHVIVVGGGDSAVEEATYLAGLADKVTVFHRRDKLRAQQILQERAFANEKIEFVWNTEVEEILGDDKKVTGVRVHNNVTDEVYTVDAAGVFIYVGVLPVSDVVADLGITNDQGWIKTNERMETSLPGIYALGDVREKELRQITTAVGDAAIAGQNVFSYNENFKLQQQKKIAEA
ncbi:thioredoxin-disulfide reductase [Weissella paramesenteroides]|jgi:thioredoxin reductase (NADPH)|uniref:Thioredoxin reductase n=2 Tax=Weissella paramesenteroides TaxID=1249 RepID=C5R7U5_WEIPA|nr:thioredoxin-disulfide reductase [Weissella paramesenteroides]ATF41624.1 thioredoxin-disulfide reductase [Weissella paramesenteroides]EER75733.1 thioredoxin-disulfide reductase [Weissella paramesenteroides ATCC 33313]KAA8455200.1 thioredoxin-disulfide reductase [Weissella paramesenteroides]KAA8456340.1 thioredoxin-disulfide reductase [Weissella paramesenteroides]KAA8458170.1 thioredoxin-disulfide reductase [Weissella paramesenteroides]